MNILKKTGLILTVVSSLGACQMRQGGTLEKPSSMAYMVDPTGCVIGAGTVGTSMDASFTFAGRYCRHPVTGGWALLKGDGTFGPTLAGQALQAFIDGPLTAATQGLSGVAIAKATKCKNCTATPPVTINNLNQSEAFAGAESINTIDNASTVKTGTGW
jgi:hypothetical protein